MDSFHDTFKNTKVKTITNPDMFNTVSKGIGRSPTLPIPWLRNWLKDICLEYIYLLLQ